MQKILNQEEIDALFQRARGAKTAARAGEQRHITLCDFRSAGQITKEQLRLLTGLHEAFARNLGHSLGAYLRIAMDMADLWSPISRYCTKAVTKASRAVLNVAVVDLSQPCYLPRTRDAMSLAAERLHPELSLHDVTHQISSPSRRFRS